MTKLDTKNNIRRIIRKTENTAKTFETDSTLFLLGFFRLCNTEGGRIPPPLAKIFKNGSNELKLGRVIVLHKIYQKKQEWYSMVPDFADVSTFLLLDQQNQRNLVLMGRCLKKVIK